MKLLYSDFSILYAATARGAALPSVLKCLISDGITPTFGQTLGGIARLSALGLLEFRSQELILTEAGQDFLRSGKKLFESRQRRKARLEKRFYEQFDLPVPEASGKTYVGEKITPAEFSDALASAAALLNIRVPKPVVRISVTGNAQTFSFPGIVQEDDTDPEEAEDQTDPVRSFECPLIADYDLIGALASAIYSMADTCVPRRQLCIPCVSGRSHVLTLSRNGQGEIRVSAAEIRFNSRRFTGRADGDLDYAQCGDKSVDFCTDPYTLAADTASALASLSYGSEFELMLAQNRFPSDTLNSLRGFAR